MKWASTVYTGSTDIQGLDSAIEKLLQDLDAEQCDLLFLFVSPHFKSQYSQIAERILVRLSPTTMIGCSGMAVIGGGEEVEHAPALSLIAATLPGVTCHAVYTDAVDLPDNDAPPEQWKEWLGLSTVQEADFVLLADPFSTPVEQVVLGIDYAFPQATVVGGLASAAGKARENAIFLNDQIYRDGMVALALHGNIQLDAIVAQGCKPIGEPLTVTCCNHNILLEANGKQPVQLLEELIHSLDEYDRNLLQTSLFLGLEMTPFNSPPQQGGFLVRNLLGIDYEHGSMAVGALLHEGQVVQFHLRDKLTSALDLDIMLSQYLMDEQTGNAAGALLFSCLGRGEQLYGTPNHDSDRFASRIGNVPLAGFFCNGEIGPVGPSTYVHGYTSSFGIFRPRTSTSA